MHRHLRRALIVAGVVTCATAHASSQITGATTTTVEVTGDASNTHHALDVVTTVPSGSNVKTTTRQWALSGVAWSEDADKPCWFLLYRSSLDGAFQDLAGTVWSMPGCTSPGSMKSLALGEKDLFVKGVSICTTDKSGTKDNRLKGFELQYAKVTDGVVGPVIQSRREKRTNCSWWREPAVVCPAGQIAVGMDFQYGDKGVMGVKLRCARVEDV